MTDPVANEATPAEEVRALRLPEYVHQATTTHHLEAARASIEHAQAAPVPRDKAIHAGRAEEHLLYARRAVKEIMARWAEYNQRADLLIQRLEDQ